MVCFNHQNEGERKMKNQTLILASIMLTIIVILNTESFAEQQTVDLTVCSAGTCDEFSKAEDMKTMSCQSRGIGWSNTDYKELETFTVFDRCLLGIKDGKWNVECLTKYMDSEGDYIIFLKNELYGGTGKWKGAQGSYKAKRIRSGKSLPAGNHANCRTITLSIEKLK